MDDSCVVMYMAQFPEWGEPQPRFYPVESPFFPRPLTEEDMRRIIREELARGAAVRRYADTYSATWTCSACGAVHPIDHAGQFGPGGTMMCCGCRVVEVHPMEEVVGGD